jgi:hypothetical protein
MMYNPFPDGVVLDLFILGSLILANGHMNNIRKRDEIACVATFVYSLFMYLLDRLFIWHDSCMLFA